MSDYQQQLEDDAHALCPAPLPCPFCGGTELTVYEHDFSIEAPVGPGFECTGCQCMAPARTWNTRTASPQPGA